MIAASTAVAALAFRNQKHPLSLGETLVGAAEYSFIVGIAGCLFVFWLRLRGRVAFLDPDGVGMEAGGERPWTLPWSQFGSYRPTKVRPLDSLIHPERFGIEVLDRSGRVVGVHNVGADRRRLQKSRVDTSLAVHRAFILVLDEHTLNLPDHCVGRQPPTSLGPAMALTLAIPGSIAAFGQLFVIGMALPYLRDGTDPGGMVGWAARPSTIPWIGLGCLVSSTVAAVGWLSIGSRKLPELFADDPSGRAAARSPDPEEGPRIEEQEVALALGELDLSYHEGVRYRYAHPEAIARGLRVQMATGRFVQVLFSGLSLLAMAFGVGATRSPSGLLSWALLALTVVGLAEIGRRVSLTKLARLGDMVVLLEGEIVVVAQDGKYRRFRPKRNERIMWLCDRKGVNRLDRAELYPSETRCEPAELGSL